MRTIDADALKELFSEVIGHIAKKPEMNGNLEHMIRASAMVIQMIDDAPTVQPDTTTHDSIPAETGKNDGDGTSGDCISRRTAIDAICEDGTWLERQGRVDITMAERKQRDVDIISNLPSIQPKGTRLSTVCLLCKKPAVTFNTEDDIPYTNYSYCEDCLRKGLKLLREQKKNSQAQPERKTGRWILDRSGAYCCNKCMEPCATYAMMKPRDKFCKMCGSRNEVTE